MRFLIRVILLPFRIVLGGAAIVLRAGGLFVGFTYRALGFFSGRAVAVVAAGLIGLFLCRNHLRRTLLSGKKPRR